MATTLGGKINSLRKKKGLTLEQLADKTDSSKGYIWELENRETKNPSAEKLRKIAEALDVTTDFLLDHTQQKPSDDITKKAIFRKFEKLGEDDQAKILNIIEAWSNK